jgi:hypothetical protein
LPCDVRMSTVVRGSIIAARSGVLS